MSGATTFSSDKESLGDLLLSISKGKTQLPDFQRGWIWDDEHIRSLLASISMSYPIGAVMMLETGGAGIRFKPRLVEGVALPSKVEPERLILDGQQRLTSLYRALSATEPVKTKDSRGKEILRWYYLDICRALSPNGDLEEPSHRNEVQRSPRHPLRHSRLPETGPPLRACGTWGCPLPVRRNPGRAADSAQNS